MSGDTIFLRTNSEGDIYLVTDPDLDLTTAEDGDKDNKLRTLKQPLNVPTIVVEPDVLNASMAEKKVYQTPFLRQSDSLLALVRKNGWKATLGDYLQEMSHKENGYFWNMVSQLVGLGEQMGDGLSHYFPTFWGFETRQIEEYSPVIGWDGALVKALAWHPHTCKVAVAYSDHSVKVHSFGGPTDLVPTLKHKHQKGVTCMAWQSFSASVLAVGCQTGILIWHVDPKSLSARPSSSALHCLPCDGHSPITSLAWSPDGFFLLSSSVSDSSIRIWDVAQERYEELSRKEGGGNCLLRWSPDGSKVVCATARSVIRVWDTASWMCEKWSDLSGRCKSACWSCNSEKLLFTTESEPIVYCLSFARIQGRLVGGAVAVPTLDLRTVCFPGISRDRYEVGAAIQNMVWDKSCTALALLIKGEHLHGDILLFHTATTVTGDIDIRPSAVLVGHPSCFAQTIAFSSTSPILTVAWSNGLVGYIPASNLTAQNFISRASAGSSEKGPILYSVS